MYHLPKTEGRISKKIVELENRITKLEMQITYAATDKHPIEVLELSVRSMNACKNANIKTIESLKKKIDSKEILTNRNFGKKSLEEVTEKLKEFYDEINSK